MWSRFFNHFFNTYSPSRILRTCHLSTFASFTIFNWTIQSYAFKSCSTVLTSFSFSFNAEMIWVLFKICFFFFFFCYDAADNRRLIILFSFRRIIIVWLINSDNRFKMSTPNGSASSGYTTGGASISSSYPASMTTNGHTTALYSSAPLPAPLASLNALTQQAAQNALLATPGPIAPAPSFDTESILSIKSERLPRAKHTLQQSLGGPFMPSSLPRTHSSLSHYNGHHSVGASNLHHPHPSGPQQLVNYGFLGPKMPTSMFGHAQQPAKLSQALQGQQHSLAATTPSFTMNSQMVNESLLSSPTAVAASPNTITSGLSQHLQQQQQHMSSPLSGSASNLHNNLIAGSSHVYFPSSAPSASFANLTLGTLPSSSSNHLHSLTPSFVATSATASGAASPNPLTSTTANKSRSVSNARLDRHVINNNFKNTNNASFLASAAYPPAATTSNPPHATTADDNQSFFNDNCTAITGNYTIASNKLIFFFFFLWSLEQNCFGWFQAIVC